ncbi:MAG: BREX-1 system phosphatase PglZ type A, partial [Bullifex sp.]
QFCVAIPTGAIDYLSEVRTLVDNKYLNSFLRPLNEEWSKEAVKFLKSGWQNPLMCIREKFFPYYVKNILDEKRTAVVIISDALRYEVAKELASIINSENRFSAVVDACISAVPSYTQAGMAALLPNRELVISPEGDEVAVDGKSSKGSINREQILNGVNGAKVLDIREVLNEMDTTKLRNIIRDYRIVYIYQNEIDARGEADLIASCTDAVRQLREVVKKLGSSNVSTMFITSDHGFLFQNQDLTDCDFLSEGSIAGNKVTKKTRRFVLGYGLDEVPGTVVANVSDIGYANTDGLQVAFPNSILRFRLSGADTHFVHGGLSLQEVVVPVMKISKGRSEDVSYVELQLLSRLNAITTGSLSVKFYQSDYVSEKNRGFDAVFGIYAEDGTLVSNEIRKSIRSDAVEVRDREFQIDFSLNSESNRFRGSNVYVTVRQVVDNGRTKDIIRIPVLLKRNSVFGELDF